MIVVVVVLWALVLWWWAGSWTLVFTTPFVVATAHWAWCRWRNARQAVARGPRFFTAEMRRNILARWGDRCVYCGPLIGTVVHYRIDCPRGPAGCPDDYEADHVLAWDDGGSTVEANGVVSCRACNQTKGARDPEEFVAWLWSPEGQAWLTRRQEARCRGQ